MEHNAIITQYYLLRYKKQCPFCKSIVTGYELNNAICKCGAKYYCLSDTWLQRKGAKEVRGNLWHK